MNKQRMRELAVLTICCGVGFCVTGCRQEAGDPNQRAKTVADLTVDASKLSPEQQKAREQGMRAFAEAQKRRGAAAAPAGGAAAPPTNPPGPPQGP